MHKLSDPHVPQATDCANALSPPSRLRAILAVVRVSFQRHARAHWLVWIALSLLALTAFVVWINTVRGRWSMTYWRYPRRVGPEFSEYLLWIEMTVRLPWAGAAAFGPPTTWGILRATLFDGSGFFVFSNWLVFSIFTTFLLPLWTLTFATEGLGREREAGNLLWLLMRPAPRPWIYLAKYAALLPWCVLLTLGGFWVLCALARAPGRLAFQVYWPAVLLGTLAFAALFHLMSALFRRGAVIALLYAFFFETIAGNLPGHLKRLSISFYTRCLMFDRAHDYGIHPERVHIYLPVSGTTALWVLAFATILFLMVGMVLFARREYLDVN